MTRLASSRIISRFFMFLSLPLLFGCGSGGNPENLDPVEETRISIGVVGGKQGINVMQSSDGKSVRFLGEIEDKGLRAFCPVDITFIPKGKGGTPVSTSVRAEIYGYTLSFPVPGKNGEEKSSCLKPGQKGSFDTKEIPLNGVYDDFEYKICLKGNEEACQRLCLNSAEEKCPPPDQRPSDIVEVEDPRVSFYHIATKVDLGDGMKAFRAKVTNASTDPNIIAYDIRLHYTARNDQGKILGTAISDWFTSQPCGDYGIRGNPSGPLGCLTQEQPTNELPFNTRIPALDICDGCFEFRVYHSECTLVGGNPPFQNGSCPDS